MSTDAKAEARKQWSRTPCGTGSYLDSLPRESLEWFDEVRRNRYTVDSWMPRVMPFAECGGKRLLEVGHGVGSDLLTFAENGALVSGIDLTPEHHRLAKKNFELHGVTADLRLGDAAALPWADESQDVVYCFGVLHHTPDPDVCVREVLRVLKPGGLFVIGVYRFWSAFHLWTKVVVNGLLMRQLFRLGYSGLLSTIENGADGVHVKPLVSLYSRRRLARLLSGFAAVRYRVGHFRREHLPILGRLIPPSLEGRLEPWLGWYLVAFATKAR